MLHDEVGTERTKAFKLYRTVSVRRVAPLHQPNADYYPSMQIRQVVKVEKRKN
jgi:hypothetical protein